MLKSFTSQILLSILLLPLLFPIFFLIIGKLTLKKKTVEIFFAPLITYSNYIYISLIVERKFLLIMFISIFTLSILFIAAKKVFEKYNKLYIEKIIIMMFRSATIYGIKINLILILIAFILITMGVR